MKTILNRAFALLFSLAMPSLAIAQTTEDVQSFWVNILGLEYGYEQTLDEKTTIIWHGGFGGELGYWYTSFGSYEHDEWRYSIRVTAGAELRYYYNLAKRAGKGKNTRRNSANFISADLSYYTPPIASKGIDGNNAIYVTPAWGLRRVYSNNLFLEFKAGVSAGTQGSEWGIGPHINIKFGYTF